MLYLNASPLQQINAIGEAILARIDDALDTSLNDEFAAFNARTIGDIERGAIGIVVATGNLGDGIGFGMEDVGLGDTIFVLTDIFKSRGRAVVSIADNHLILDDEGTYLAPLAIRVLRPNFSHAQVAFV